MQITDRGRPVALLVPTAADPWEQLILGGRIIPPSGEGDIADAAPADFGLDASARLAAMREHER